MDPLLAHQGGWDELLFVLAPIVVFAALLWRTNRRARKAEAPQADRQPGRDQA